MTTKSCGCSTTTCGCCEGTKQWTPLPTANRPGLDALAMRIGTHGTFLATMKARLSTITVTAPGADGQTVETTRPLTGLTTRDSSDPAIALLDGWALVGDVLAFYQERIANEGYLRSATERRSVLELARLVGYTPRPGVAATTYLAFEVDSNQPLPVEIPAGARAQSIPGPDERPQSFETGEPLIARAAWNNLQVRKHRPVKITWDDILIIQEFYVTGASTNLKKGDLLLFDFSDGGEDKRAIRTIAETESQFARDRTRVRLAPIPLGTLEAMRFLPDFLTSLEERAKKDPAKAKFTAVAELLVKQLLAQVYLDSAGSPLGWADLYNRATRSDDPDGTDALRKKLQTIVRSAKAKGETAAGRSRDEVVKDLLQQLQKDPHAQPPSALGRTRVAASEFAADSDVHAQLLVHFEPRLEGTFYPSLAGAPASSATYPLQGIYALRVTAPLFGATASKITTYSLDPANERLLKVDPPDSWEEWQLADDETADALFLDQAYEGILPGSLAVVQKTSSAGTARQILSVEDSVIMARGAYNLSARSTRLQFDEDWRDGEALKERSDLRALRNTLVFAQSELLLLAEEDIDGDVYGQELELEALYDGLAPGRWIILTGERADIEGVSGVVFSELLMISGVRQTFDPALPGDQVHTTLLLATETAYRYRRKSVTIQANVAKATHGETRPETLGSGQGSVPLQSFVLKQPPLTFVSAPTPAGTASTLHVFVNNVEWHEVETLAGRGPKERVFTTLTADDAATTLVFGNGVHGARLPSGVENVKALYRSGIGKEGNVKAGQISQLMTRPQGLKGVVNPLRASGGADKETRDQMRENAPVGLLALDRLVSVQDYADFTRTFAGIAKATAAALSNGRGQMIHLTVAGADDIPIEPESDVYRNLLLALRRFGDADVPVKVQRRELFVLTLCARVQLLPDYRWEPVATAVTSRLQQAFGFARRALGQAVLLSEVISVMQLTPGVSYVDVDAFGGIPEKKANPDGTRRLLSLEELADAALSIVLHDSPASPPARVAAALADVEEGGFRPAQLAIFVPEIPGTIVLRQIA